MSRLHDKYGRSRPCNDGEVRIQKRDADPRLEKIVINMGLGEAKDNPKSFDAAVADLTVIAGQKPQVTVAKKSIANFKPARA